jgi:hypothetical protein
LEYGSKKNPSVQLKTNRNPKNGNEEIMKPNLKKIHVQRKIWKPHGKTSFCWIFYWVNDNAKVGLVNTQIMHYVFCYQNPVIKINLRTQVKKGLIFLLQNQWNNFSLKSCGCRSFFYCKNV